MDMWADNADTSVKKTVINTLRSLYLEPYVLGQHFGQVGYRNVDVQSLLVHPKGRLWRDVED